MLHKFRKIAANKTEFWFLILYFKNQMLDVLQKKEGALEMDVSEEKRFRAKK